MMGYVTSSMRELQPEKCAGTHRSKVSPCPRKATGASRCTNRFLLRPRARSRTPTPGKGLNIKRSEVDFLSIKSWVTL